MPESYWAAGAAGSEVTKGLCRAWPKKLYCRCNGANRRSYWGGLGGCVRDVAETLGLVKSWPGSRDDWPGRWEFKNFGPDDLRNGLSVEENRALAETPYIDEALPLILKGLRNLRRNDAQDVPGQGEQ